MANTHKTLFTLILLAYLGLGGLYAALTPPWQAPDEPAHFNYVHYVAVTSAFPELTPACYNQAYLEQLTSRRFPPNLSLDFVCYEYHQPPLYYALAAPVFVLSGGALLAVRLFSVGLGAGVVILAFAVVRTVLPQRPAVALGTMAFTAFVPMHLTMLASANNDALAELLIAAILLLLARRLMVDVPLPPRTLVLPGVLLGLGLVTKVSVYIAVPLIAAALWGTSPTWKILLRQGVIIFGLALLIALPWYGRNAVLYGGVDILGLNRHDSVVVGQLRTADYLAQVGWPQYAGDFLQTTFRSFWGQFGWMAVPMDGRTYWLLLVLTGLAAAGLILWIAQARRLPPGPRRALALLALAALLMAAGYGWYNIGFVQFQGRYLFPALVPLGLFFSLGLAQITAWPRRYWLVAGLLLALIAAAVVGQPDKWAMLWLGLALVAAVGRIGLARFYRLPDGWLAAMVYLALAALALLSPFWFIVPHLAVGR